MSNYIISVEAWNIRDRSGTAAAQRAEDLTWRSKLDAEAKKADLSDCTRRQRCLPVVGTHTSRERSKC